MLLINNIELNCAFILEIIHCHRMKKMAETVEKKKAVGGMRGAPICVALIPLSATTNVDFMLKFILSNVKGFGTVVGQSAEGAATHVK